MNVQRHLNWLHCTSRTRTGVSLLRGRYWRNFCWLSCYCLQHADLFHQLRAFGRDSGEGHHYFRPSNSHHTSFYCLNRRDFIARGERPRVSRRLRLGRDSLGVGQRRATLRDLELHLTSPALHTNQPHTYVRPSRYVRKMTEVYPCKVEMPQMPCIPAATRLLSNQRNDTNLSRVHGRQSQDKLLVRPATTANRSTSPSSQ